ncbi:hypothetical protein [Nocardia pseudovaccinii]|uniref:hypothetical protein n=1 Tax=Nocardia pseudovaccinii TaxID=189540 RepID=UPI0007A3A85D|nr:hypothetical protein [Nocardia pseudovaccinii]
MTNSGLPAPPISVSNYEERMALRFGFRRSRGRACPRYAAGRRCKEPYGYPHNDCGVHYGWFDHSYRWIAPDRHRIFTTEPYSNTIKDKRLSKLRDGLVQLDLAMTVFDRRDSMWYPGSTILIVVHSPEWVPDQRLQKSYARWARDAKQV